MKFDKEAMVLYGITDRAWTGEKSLEEEVEEALKGGVTCLQVREKELDYEDFLEEAKKLAKLCRAYDVPFIINDNVEIAKEIGADGVHVGQNDMEARRAREILGEKAIIGVSAENLDQAKKALEDGADYLGVGAIFPTATKEDASLVSMEELQKICRAVDIPVVAIGGIHEGNIGDLKGMGLDGVALVSAIFGAEDIQGQCKKLRKLSEEMVKGGDQ